MAFCSSLGVSSQGRPVADGSWDLWTMERGLAYAIAAAQWLSLCQGARTCQCPEPANQTSPLSPVAQVTPTKPTKKSSAASDVAKDQVSTRPSEPHPRHPLPLLSHAKATYSHSEPRTSHPLTSCGNPFPFFVTYIMFLGSSKINHHQYFHLS